MKNGKNTGFDTKTIDNLRRELPAVFGRQAVGKLIPGIISEKSLANLAVNDEGPPYKVVRRRVCGVYPELGREVIREAATQVKLQGDPVLGTFRSSECAKHTFL